MFQAIQRFAKKLSQETPSQDDVLVREKTKNPFIFNLYLTGIENHFDPDVLWSKAYSGNNQVKELTSQRKDFRLFDKLNACRKKVSKWDDDIAGLIADDRVFSDVLISIPERIWRDTSHENDDLFILMMDKLTRRHNETFGRELLHDRLPRYHIIPSFELDDDQILAQFGSGVFMPDADDRVVAEIELIDDEHNNPLPEWQMIEFSRGRARYLSRSVGLYDGQSVLLLSLDKHLAVINPDNWMKQGEWMCVNFKKNIPEVITSSDKVICQAVELNADQQQWDIRLLDQTSGCYFQIVLRLNEAFDDMDEAQKADQGKANGTLVFSDPSAGARLEIIGIALPKFSPHQLLGVREWRLQLDEQGSPSETGTLLLKNRREDKRLKLHLPDERHAKDLYPDDKMAKLAKKWAGLTIQSAPSRDYFGILSLQEVVNHALSIAKTGQVVGREPEPNEKGISLTLLAQRQSLLWENNRSQSSLNQLISGRYVHVLLKDGELTLTQLSKSLPIYLLDAQGQITQTLGADSSDKVQLQDGDTFMLNLYVLRFRNGQN